ncbi:MAG: hypothetical protein M1837_001398 [Sclerophora amabilis]|nr:MAG: hypothetical protein M1837_001398 [Sclerophora amabilis]
MESSAAPPTIPERTHRIQQSRRRSLPPPATPKSGKTSANRVRVQPASPEVISSLISSLSAISSPVDHHFETSPPSIGESRSSPASPNALHTTFPKPDSVGHGATAETTSPGRGGFGMDYGAFTSHESREYLSPHDAATPPVIRTSKPPAGHSHRRAGSRSGSSPPSPVKSRFSRSSSKEFDDTGSIGSLSIEPGASSLETKSHRTSAESESKKTRKGYKGLRYMSSKERMRERDGERRRTSVHSAQGSQDGPSGGSQVGTKGLDRKPSMAEDRITEEPGLALSDIMEDQSRNTAHLGPGPPSPSLNDPLGKSANILVPVRESSLRRTTDKTPNKKRRSHHSSIPEIDGEDRRSAVGEQDQTLPEKETRVEDEGHSTDHQSTSKRELRRRNLTISPTEPLRDSSGLSHSQTYDSLPSQDSPRLAHSQARQSPAGPNPSGLSHSQTFDSFSSKPLSGRSQLGRPIGSGRESVVEEQESAPAPAILQRKGREASPRLGSFSMSQNRRSGSSPPPDFGPRAHPTLSSPLAQSVSHSKSQSGPCSPRSVENHHQRRFSNPLGRKTDPPAAVEMLQATSDDRPHSTDSVDDSVTAYLASPRLSQKIRHPQSGRTISFSEVGDPNGLAVFCCVGMGLTRYITAFYDELALTLKLRLITPDRPGVGNSEPCADGNSSPLSWPDDLYAICQALKITKFSLLAHSAGAIYALAAALRMPQHIRGRIHLLAPWIPPSQMSPIGSQQGPAPSASVPTSQRILRALPTPFLKAANSSFMSTTSSSITSSLPKSPRRKRKSTSGRAASGAGAKETSAGRPSRDNALRDSAFGAPRNPFENGAEKANSDAALMAAAAAASSMAEKERQTTYDTRLTHAIWDLATTNANPAVDLLVCLERRQTIGFRYVDITRAVVIHHGSRDTRVPVENVKWLAKTMRRCEVRILGGEGHGLMASAGVMGGVLMELAKEWEDWMKVVQQSSSGSRTDSPVLGRTS